MLIASNAATYATRVPYITPAEFRAHPTGVETKNLVPGGSIGANAQALLNIIDRASSYADRLSAKILAATVDTEAKPYHVGPGGWVQVPLKISPVIGIISTSIGLTPQSMVTLPDDGRCWLDGRILHIPTSFGGPWGCPDRVFTSVTYLNGWANAVLTAPVVPGATSLALDNGLGIMPGMSLGLTCPTISEGVTVVPTFTPVTATGPVTIPLTQPIINTYAAGDVLTAFPQDIKLAVILIATAIIKTRGSSGVSMAHVRDQPGAEEKLADLSGEEMGMAMELLADYRRNF